MQEEGKQETVDRTLPTNGVKGKPEQIHIENSQENSETFYGKSREEEKEERSHPKTEKIKFSSKKWKKKKKKKSRSQAQWLSKKTTKEEK